MYFIEKFYSSFTRSFSYSTRPRPITELNQTLKETADCSMLKTVWVIKFKTMKEKNGIYWYPRCKQLYHVPFANYIIPPLFFLTGEKPPRKLKKYDKVRELPKPVTEPYKAKTGELAFN